MKKIGFALLLCLLPFSLFAGSKSYKCDTRYPVILSHGMGASYEIAWGIAKYWHRIPETLREEGARVYITNVNAMDTTKVKAASWHRQVLDILAITGAQKVNIIGHSHGSIYSRYGISNLPGLKGRIASHTSIAGPHRGSAMAEIVSGMIDGNILEGAINAFMKFIMANNNADTVANLEDLTREYMKNVFNPDTPDDSGIYYQSYAYVIKSILGSGLFVASWPILYYYEGDNDGLVSVTSAKWGKFRGIIKGAWWAGVNHLGAVDMMWGITPGFNAPDHFVNIVKDLKNKGF